MVYFSIGKLKSIYIREMRPAEHEGAVDDKSLVKKGHRVISAAFSREAKFTLYKII